MEIGKTGGQNQWIEVSRSALKHNLSLIRKSLSPKTQLMAMVKANAYGHGIEQVGPQARSLVDWFGVHTWEEALTLRRLKIAKPILITSPISFNLVPRAEKNQISVCVPSIEYLKRISRFPVTVHLKVNTGMNRLGLAPNEVAPALDLISRSRMHLQGVYTHFHSADIHSPTTADQLALFKQIATQVKSGSPQVLAHCANTAATLLLPQSRLDMVRIGIGMYGLYPSAYVKSKTSLNLKPVLSWKCRVVQTQQVAAGETVGYSAGYKFKADSLMATLPVGYSDGFDRGLSNTGVVYIHGQNCPVVGQVSMNFTTVKLSSKTKFRSTQEAELIGRHSGAVDMAEKLVTISYEVLARLNPLIPRILI